MDERIEELIPFYTLGGLTQAEKNRVETYLNQNPEAWAQLDNDRWVVAALTYGVQPIQPSLRLKKELMARVKQELRREQSVEAVPATPATSVGFWEYLRRSLAGNGPAFALAGLTILLVLGLGGWANSINNRLEQLQQANFALERQLADQTETLIALNQQIAPLRTENDDLKRQLADQTKALMALNEQVIPLQAENTALERELASQAEQLALLEAAAAPSPTDKAALEAIASLKNELAAQQEVLVSLNEQMEKTQAVNAVLVQELSTQRAIMAEVTTPNARIMAMSGTESLPQAIGQLIADPGASRAVVLVSGLPRLQPGFFYQFWLVQEGTPVRAGELDVDEAGLGVLQVTSDLPIGTYEAMGLSIEPVNITSDTHDMIMLGKVSS